MNKIHGFALLILVVAIACGYALAAGQQVSELEYAGITPSFLMLVATLLVFAIQWLAFIPAYLNETEHFYDLVGGMSYLLFIALIFVFSQQADLRSILLSLLVSIWAIRLSLFLFKRVRQDGSDSRFDAIKPDFMAFLLAWTVQGLWVVITAGCAAAAINSSQKVALTFLDMLALVMWIVGFTIEVVADRQKRQFKRQIPKSHAFISQGLWRYSRHPNYFGEILLWSAVALLAFPVLGGWQYLTLISPLFVFFLLTKVSGIPLLEAKADKRWQDLEAYQRYKSTTPVLLPKLSIFWTKAHGKDTKH